MKKYVEKLKKELLKSSIFFLFFMFVSFTVLILYVYDSSYKRTINEFERVTQSSYTNILDETIIKYKNISKRIASLPEVGRYLKEKNRQAIYSFLKLRWQRLKSDNPYLRTMLIISADGKALIRMHKPSVYGDNIASLRPMLKAEIHTKKNLVGYETGKYATVYRIITPVFYKGEYVGAIDLGINPLFIVKEIRKMLGYNGFLFIKKSSLKLLKFKRNTNIEVGGFILQKDKSNKDIKLLKNADVKNILEDNRLLRIYNTQFLTHVFDIKNYKGVVNAKLVFLQDVTNLYYSKLNFISILVGLSAVGLVVVLWFIDRQIKILETGLEKVNSEHLSAIKRERRELKNFKKMFSAFADHSPFLIYIKDENFKYVYGNKTFRELICEDCELGKRVEDVADEETAKRISELDRRVLKEKNVESVETIRGISEEEKIFRIYKFLIEYDGKKYIGNISADITENYLMHKKMIESEKILRKAQKIAHIGYFLYKIEDKKLELSDELLSVFGFKKGEFSNMRDEFLKYVHKDDVEKVNRAFYYALSGKGERIVQYRLFRKNDASLRYLEARYETVMDENGRVFEVMGVTQDITEWVELQNKLKEKEELMIAQSRHAAMGEMISMIAHQWRQPLSVISMGINNILIDMELDELDNEELKRAADEIIKQTQYLSKTIDDFRDFFKPSTNRETVSVDDVVEEAVRFVEKSLENNSIELKKTFEAGSKIKTYSRQLLQVLITVIQNSKEALVENNTDNRFISLETYEEEENVCIKICDNAGGISDDIADKVFEPYFSTKEEKTGTGLGLYMAKIIMEKHITGRIWFENNSDGVCFFIEIPKEEKNGGKYKTA